MKKSILVLGLIMLMCNAGVAQADVIWSAPVTQLKMAPEVFTAGYGMYQPWTSTTTNLSSAQQGQSSLMLSTTITVGGLGAGSDSYWLLGGTSNSVPFVGYTIPNSYLWSTQQYTFTTPVDIKANGIYSLTAFSVGPGAYFWHMDEATLSTNQKPAKTPLPAAVWLFGSGLVGLVGLKKRKKLKA